jgi:hypothetical protein
MSIRRAGRITSRPSGTPFGARVAGARSTRSPSIARGAGAAFNSDAHAMFRRFGFEQRVVTFERRAR